MANKSGSPAGRKGASPRLERGETLRRKPRAFPVLAGLSLALALGAAVFLIGRGRGAFGARSAAGHNVLLITLDTTRADRLGCYGYGQARTPRLDGLARDGIRFARTYCPAPLTLPSHSTTSSPRSRRAATRFTPTKPAPPVTNTVISKRE